MCEFGIFDYEPIYSYERLLFILEKLRKDNKLSYAGVGRILRPLNEKPLDRSVVLRLFNGFHKFDIPKVIRFLEQFGKQLCICDIPYSEPSIEEAERQNELFDVSFELHNNPEYKEGK